MIAIYFYGFDCSGVFSDKKGAINKARRFHLNVIEKMEEVGDKEFIKKNKLLITVISSFSFEQHAEIVVSKKSLDEKKLETIKIVGKIKQALKKLNVPFWFTVKEFSKDLKD